MTHSEPLYRAPPAGSLAVVNCVKGGIGNQLFQHVFAKSLAQKLGADLLTDFAFLRTDTNGNTAALHAFDPDLKEASISTLPSHEVGVLREGGILTLSDQMQIPPQVRYLALDGYWQFEALQNPAVVWDTYQALGRSRSAARHSSWGQAICQANQSVALHVRRRDYGYMGLCEDHYYLGALMALHELYPDLKAFVFTDEANYARQLFKHGPQIDIHYVASGDDMADLFLMTLCRHFIIANSTYSWWAARFGEGQGGKVICPREWVAMTAFQSPCPERWISVEGAVRTPCVNHAECNRVKGHIAASL